MRQIYCVNSTAPAAPNPVAPLPPAPTPTVVPPLPQLPLTKTAYPAPPPPPQVFIIKENSVSTKDPEDSKSAEALDNLSQSFENAFTKALKSQRRKTKKYGEPRRGHVSQRPEERENLDSEDEVTENEENEDDEEKVQSNGGSRGDLEDDDIKEDSDISQENDNDDDRDDDDDDDDVDQVKADKEPPYDLDQPRYSHSWPFYEEDEHQDSTRREEKDQSRKRKKYLGFKQYGKNEDLRAKKADREQLSYGRSKNAFSNRYVERQGFRSHIHREKHPTLKTTKYNDRSRGYDIDSIYGESTQKAPTETVSVTSQRHKGKSKHFNSQKRRSKFQHYSKDLSQVSASHDTSNFAHLQDQASHKHGRMHGRDHHTRHKQSKTVKKSHSKTEMIPEDEITEDVGSTSEGNDYSGDDNRLAVQKSIETFSSSGNYEKSSPHRPVEDTYMEEHKKPPLTTVKSFKPGLRPKFSKRKKIKSDKNIAEDVSYSSGEESGERENNDTDGDEYY